MQASDTEDTDSESSVGRVTEHNTEIVRQAGQRTSKCKVVTMKIQAVDNGRHREMMEFKPLVDSGVHKTLICESDWKVIKK